MGRVTVPAIIESLEDLYRVHRGEMTSDKVRRFDVAEALVDTGATSLALPAQMIRELGLFPLQARQAMTSSGVRSVPTFGAVRLSVKGRDCTCDVTEVDDACPVLIGQVPLELMDFIVDPKSRQLIGNPAHGGNQMMELL